MRVIVRQRSPQTTQQRIPYLWLRRNGIWTAQQRPFRLVCCHPQAGNWRLLWSPRPTLDDSIVHMCPVFLGRTWERLARFTVTQDFSGSRRSFTIASENVPLVLLLESAVSTSWLHGALFYWLYRPHDRAEQFEQLGEFHSAVLSCRQHRGRRERWRTMPVAPTEGICRRVDQFHEDATMAGTISSLVYR